MRQRQEKISLPTAIGFGLTDIMGGGAFTVIGAFMLFFYTTFAGLSAVQAASIIGIARIVDAFSSLVIGSLTDNFYKTKIGRKVGRRHFFLLIGSPLMLVYALLWVTGMGYWYYLFTYLAFEIIAASVLIPWETLPSEMTESFVERTKLSTARMVISALGTFLATFIPGRLIAYMGDDKAYPYFVNGLILAVVFAICIFISYKTTWERTPDEVVIEENSLGIWGTIKKEVKDYLSTLKIRGFRKHLAIYLLSFTGKDVHNTIFVFFTVYCLNISSATAANLLSLSIIGILITLVAGFLIVKIGPSRLLQIGYTLMLLMLGAYYIVYLEQPTNSIFILYVIALIYQVGRAILECTPRNVFPFIPDLDEIVTQKRREGIYAAVMTFTRKSTVAIATFFYWFNFR
ncbi:Glucuronide permease [Paenibacillus larvae subsp. larvae]|uniref:Glucuronide permease n=1 Tax=Paenibacillus larvae subsp. larvae TaxID=147375 RepID=A0A2L1TWV6_9BACL|nr:MFS transporter [Paenibacillus larvae]AVF25167.1 Glucuronide permease [Paenibacillus larvae subsp. larvae]AVF29943.1 Glucuronide permease [Paenibacillus larvae subsp. larvae]MCY7519630.1 MFS transporter [Paenibacillus larvae]MCY9499083.1 MFS transporter [Paenibacillus larvae]MCY9681464.1 MFS transporter [Paenibacillus larvae]